MARTDAQTDATLMTRNRVRGVAMLVLAAVCVLLAVFVLAYGLGLTSRSPQATMEYAQAETNDDVLLIMSYNESEANTPSARDGVLDVLGKASVNVDVVYMDAYNAPLNSSSYHSWVSQLCQKVAQHGAYSAVICCDDEAMYFMEYNHDSIFGSTPVVFFGANDYAHAVDFANKSYATGMLEQSYMGSIMEVTYKMHPEATSFTAIVDQTPAGIGNKAQFESAAREYSDMGVRYIDASKLSRSELASAIASVEPNTIVFLLDANNDRNGNVYSFDDSIAWVTSASNSPVYRGTIGGVGNGIAGSSYLDPEADGRTAAQMVVDVINGVSPSSISLVVDGTLGYVFDGQVLSDYGISTFNIPFGSTIINRQLFTFDTLRVIAILLILVLLAVLLILKARKTFLTRLISVAVSDGNSSFDKDDVDVDIVEEAVETEEVVAPTAMAATAVVEEAPAKTIDSAASRTKKQQMARDSKRRGTKKGHQRQLRKTHSVAVEEVPKDSVEEEALSAQPEQEAIIDAESETFVDNSRQNDDEALAETVVGDVVENAVTEKMQVTNAEITESIVEVLEAAIKDDAFLVYYQPQICLQKNEVVGYEALARLKNKAYEPAQFIPVAEETGLIVGIDRIIAKRCVEQLAIWKRRNKRMRPISINFSPVNLSSDGDFAAYLLGLLEENGVSSDYIKIEVTEDLFMDENREKAEKLVKKLFDAGVSIALDNFGVGYTSFADTMTIPASVIKIDKEFVDTFLIDGSNQNLEQLVRLAHGLGRKVVVVGVDKKWQVDVCRELDCDVVQGFYFSKPLLPENAVQFKPRA